MNSVKITAVITTLKITIFLFVVNFIDYFFYKSQRVLFTDVAVAFRAPSRQYWMRYCVRTAKLKNIVGQVPKNPVISALRIRYFVLCLTLSSTFFLNYSVHYQQIKRSQLDLHRLNIAKDIAKRSTH